ncbi:MAG: hypothetical protein VCA73_07370 [Roseibacillus sp.]
MRACCWQWKRNDAAGEWFILLEGILRLKVVRAMVNGAQVDLTTAVLTILRLP